MRIITNWSKKEQEEFNDYIPEQSLSSMVMIEDITDINESLPKLHERYISNDISKDNQFAQDIVDLVTGKAKFAEQKYYVKLTDDIEDNYLNLSKCNRRLFISNSDNSDNYQTQFTMDEIKAIDERYVPFAVPVDEVEE